MLYCCILCVAACGGDGFSDSMCSEVSIFVLQVVSMGVPGINPADKVGKYVKPKDWNKLISDPNTVSVL